MLNASSKRAKFVLIVSALFILSALAPTSLAAKRPAPKDPGDSPVAVVNYAAEGNVVHVTVQNTSRTAQTVDVYVEAIVGSNLVRGYTPVIVFAKGTATTVVGFSEAVESVDVVGINEDGGPI